MRLGHIGLPNEINWWALTFIADCLFEKMFLLLRLAGNVTWYLRSKRTFGCQKENILSSFHILHVCVSSPPTLWAWEGQLKITLGRLRKTQNIMDTHCQSFRVCQSHKNVNIWDWLDLWSWGGFKDVCRFSPAYKENLNLKDSAKVLPQMTTWL